MTGGFAHVVVALVAFLATHSIPAMKPVRTRCVAVLGERGYLLAYSLLSIAVVAWVALALMAAPNVELWPMTTASMWITAAVMIPATIFLVFGLTTPNPFSIPISVKAYTADNSGILAITRHPILMGFALWALAHIPSNGSVATVLVFGFAAAFSVAGMNILDARRKRAWGLAAWQAKTANTALLRWRPKAVSWTDWRWVAVIAVYAGLIAAHPVVIGISPLP